MEDENKNLNIILDSIVKICIDCNKSKPENEFYLKRDGYERGKVCFECCLRDREESKNRNLVDHKKNIQGIINDYKNSTPCLDCKKNFPSYAMDFDHVSGNKKNNISFLVNLGDINKLREELKKCELVCSNCHRIRTYNRKKMGKSSYFIVRDRVLYHIQGHPNSICKCPSELISQESDVRDIEQVNSYLSSLERDRIIKINIIRSRKLDSHGQNYWSNERTISLMDKQDKSVIDTDKEETEKEKLIAFLPQWVENNKMKFIELLDKTGFDIIDLYHNKYI